jgi:transposase
MSTNTTKRYYVYVYEKSDGTPYYVGKGTGLRAYSDHKHIPVPLERNRIILYGDLTENEAFLLEKQLIKSYGRLIDLTGTLHNLHPGGVGKSSKEGSRVSLLYEDIRNDYLDGYSIKMVSRKYDIGIGTVYDVIEGLDITHRKPRITQPHEYRKPHGRPSRLTEDIKTKVIEEYRSGNNGVKNLSKKYLIGVGTIYKLLEQEGLYKR